MILYIGGNDIAEGCSTGDFYQQFQSLTDRLSSTHKLILCGLCPRKDIVDIQTYNTIIKDLAHENRCEFVECHPAFTFGNGEVATSYFLKDNIHLSVTGTARLLKCVDSVYRIISPTQSQSRHTTRGNNSPSQSRQYRQFDSRHQNRDMDYHHEPRHYHDGVRSRVSTHYDFHNGQRRSWDSPRSVQPHGGDRFSSTHKMCWNCGRTNHSYKDCFYL